MTHIYRRTISGFTLIELLVVVLIIGILSAVALPQYTKAVEKARVAEAKTLLKSLNDAEEIQALSNGAHTYDLSVLDITLPGNYESFGGNDNAKVKTKNFEIYLDECTCGEGNSLFCCDMYATRIGKDYEVRFVANNYDGGGKAGVFYCYNINENDEACLSAGAVRNSDGEYIFQ